ncbi:hypothetical protein PM082_016506 [Marasmius tenuissimus]|nr:hypothetical protein PM082_016506 [Marasmius tenuissimus]
MYERTIKAAIGEFKRLRMRVRHSTRKRTVFVYLHDVSPDADNTTYLSLAESMSTRESDHPVLLLDVQCQ